MLKAHKMWEANGKSVQAGNPLTAQAAASRSGSRGPGTKNASLSSSFGFGATYFILLVATTLPFIGVGDRHPEPTKMLAAHLLMQLIL